MTLTLFLGPYAIVLRDADGEPIASTLAIDALLASLTCTGALVARGDVGLVTESETHSSDRGLALWLLCEGLCDLGYEVRVRRDPAWPR